MRRAGRMRADDYLHKLIALGHRVAVCEQTRGSGRGQEARRQERWCGATWCAWSRPARSPRTRCSMRRRNNYLLALARARSSGADEPLRARLARHLDRRIPRRGRRPRRSCGRDRAARAGRDHRLPTRCYRRCRARAAAARAGAALTPLAARRVRSARRPSARLAQRSSASPTLDGFGAFSRLELAAAAALRRPMSRRTQVGKRPPLSPPAREARGATLC